ncbi:MAG: saccharopine dehydrogenase NADP-binding domain-containing protein [Elusimicrobia bacterium]|nr:saccharopine dehydrogenase NADP-binding domain-containing protein [Elusimicrobiota bacterium]
MKFMILGSGMQGRACAYDLTRNPAVESVLLADSSAENLAKAATWLKSKKVETVQLSASDTKRVVELARGRNVLISCVPYFLNLELAKAAIEAKVHFVDLGGNTDVVLQELKLGPLAAKAGVTILPDVGLGPGTTSTIAAHGIAQLDEVDEVLLRDGGLPQKPKPPMNYLLTFSEHGLINEYVADATAIRDGKRVTVPGLSETEEIELPKPLGRCEAAHAAGGLSTLAYTYEGKVRSMDCKLIRYPGHIAVINALNTMGFFSEEKLQVNGATLAPRELSAKLFRQHFERPNDKDLVIIHSTVRGEKDGRRAEIVYDMLDYFDDKSKMTAMMRTTGWPASIAAQMLATKVIDKPGAYPVELGIPAEPFFEEMKKRGLNISWQFRWLEDAPAATAAKAKKGAREKVAA